MFLPKISIVIPCYNAEKSLGLCLEALSKQTLAKDWWEVLIVDDGSCDRSREIAQKWQEAYKFSLQVYCQAHQGVGAARNLGVMRARGKIILFLGADVIADSDLLEKHSKVHEKFSQEKIAVLGFVTWHPQLIITPFMYWLEHGGPQFAYYKIKGKKWVNYEFFYTCNISLKKSFLIKYGLFAAKEFPVYGWEDLELGYRLEKKGLKIYYERGAGGFHFHPQTLDGVLSRMKKAGAMAVVFDRLHPELKILAPYQNPLKKILRQIVFIPPVILILKVVARFCEKKINIPWLFVRLTSLYFFQGIREELEKQSS